MRTMRIVGISAIAVLAISAVAAASASAHPEYFRKGEVIQKTISFTSQAPKGYSWPGGPFEINCKSAAGRGTIKAPDKTAKFKIEFRECSGILGGNSVACQKTPAKPGVIVSNALTGTLVDASEVVGGPAVIGNRLEPEVAGKPIAAYSCATLKIELGGTIIAQVEPVGVESASGNSIERLKGSEAEPGCSTQQVLYVNGAKPCLHLGGGADPVEWVSNEAIKYKMAVEIHP